MALISFTTIAGAVSTSKTMLQIARDGYTAFIEYKEAVEQKKEREQIQVYASLIELAGSIALVASATLLILGAMYTQPVEVFFGLFGTLVSLDIKYGAKNMHDRLGDFRNWIIASGLDSEKVRCFIYNIKEATKESFFLKHIINILELDVTGVVLPEKKV